jgi:outer membrane protein TolC
MISRQSSIAVLGVFLMLLPMTGFAQSAGIQPVKPATGLWQRYQFHMEPPAGLANSSRLDALLRGGNLYLSLQDAIALALENNLDIAIQRYAPRLADAALLRAKAGGGAVPSLDPTATYNVNWAHQTMPQTSSFVSGTSSLVNTSTLSNFAISQGFVTGTSATLSWNNTFSKNNSTRSDFNPSTSASFGLQVTQHLLQGFGMANNRRNIRIAQNSRKVSDLAFKQQVITTVASVMNLYWDLVSFNEDVKVKRQAVTLAEQLRADNQQQVEIGSLAPIEVVRAEAQLAGSQQDLVISQTRVLQQEAIIKNALSRTGVASRAVADAHVIPTDQITFPATEPVEPIQDLIAKAFATRPELAQTTLQVANSKIGLEGTRSALKPTLDAVGTLQNSGLAGQLSTQSSPFGTSTIDPYFLGGYGTVLGQMFRRNFPNYSVGLQLNIPLRNRAAQADMITAQVQLRQQELQQQQQTNQVGLDVTNAVIAVQQARAAHDASVKARVLQEETLSAEQEKFRLGASTSFLVIQAQRDLASALSSEVAARSGYTKAKIALDQATGRLLDANGIQLDEAVSGQVSRPPSPLPPASE